MSDTSLNSLLKFYFGLWVSQKTILEFLAQNHRIIMSRRTLQKKFKHLHLRKRKDKSDILDVAHFIYEEVQRSGCLHGYRWMHMKCIQEGLVTDRESVRILLNILDPDGIEIRKARRLRRRNFVSCGPNFTWHIDSNDKLKPFGIFINGCTDGFSRLILWVKCSGNGKAATVAYNFLGAVKARTGCPRVIRTDMGVENSVTLKIQKFLRRSHSDEFAGEKSIRVGDSRANQRIEFWWGILRKECLQFWMDLFKLIRNDGNFTGDVLDKELVRFCFIHIIQAEIDKVIAVWNNHKIQKHSSSLVPCDRPLVMYSLPHIFGYNDHLCQATELDIHVCEEEIPDENTLPCDEDVFNLCSIIMGENNWEFSQDAYESVALYLSLRQKLKHLFENV